MSQLSAAFEYFAQVSQQAITVQPPYRGVVSMLHFGDYILIKSENFGEIQRRWFHKENPIYYYHLPKEIRLPLVQGMFQAGCSISEIAEIVGLSKSTISKDIKQLEYDLSRTAHVELSLPQVKAHDVTPTDLILKSTINQKPRNFNPANAPWLQEQ
jgi:DNA-binding transcriptional ArsR family regulator